MGEIEKLDFFFEMAESGSYPFLQLNSSIMLLYSKSTKKEAFIFQKLITNITAQYCKSTSGYKLPATVLNCHVLQIA